eukprot:TRINITY_DN65816_c5_g2_i1.p1 TRINITY_DN65816_c5_g2~~TRINITY_DN65816_c5_g2_i1.p1  ORF type:complete len:489 (-),score=164.31 TRINITY_DN65816_c5_g2_i1:56-1390(-)
MQSSDISGSGRRMRRNSWPRNPFFGGSGEETQISAAAALWNMVSGRKKDAVNAGNKTVSDGGGGSTEGGGGGDDSSGVAPMQQDGKNEDEQQQRDSTEKKHKQTAPSAAKVPPDSFRMPARRPRLNRPFSMSAVEHRRKARTRFDFDEDQEDRRGRFEREDDDDDDEYDDGYERWPRGRRSGRRTRPRHHGGRGRGRARGRGRGQGRGRGRMRRGIIDDDSGEYDDGFDDDDDGVGGEWEAMPATMPYGQPRGWMDDRDMPGTLIGYLRVFVNVLLIGFFCYLLYIAVDSVQGDIEKRVDALSADIVKDIALCAREYRENKCDPATRLPAMQKECDAWERCMERDPSAVARAKLSARTLGEVINDFIDPLSSKSLIAIFVLFFGTLIVSNYVFQHAANSQQSHHHHSAASVHPPPQVHPMHYAHTPSPQLVRRRDRRFYLNSSH